MTRFEAGQSQSGQRVGPYRLLEPLGRGGVALVHRAVHEQSGQVVALKTVRMASEANLASVRREIQALGRIRHPGIVRILEGGIADGRPWYAMELLEGQTLGDRLFAQGPGVVSRTTEETLSPAHSGSADLAASKDSVADGWAGARAALSGTRISPAGPGGERNWFLTLVRQLCEPLAFLHGEGFIHRDVKPSNIWVRNDSTPVLMDFGLVWLLQEDDSREILAVDAARGGTISYMAPEQARGDRIDARADLFSVGCILYEGLTGRRPFPAATRLELVAAHGRPPPPPSSLVEDVSTTLDDLVMGLLAPQPRDRIGHASDVAAILADLGAGEIPQGGKVASKAYLYRPDLVGRGALLDTALEHVARLRQGAGGCVLVAGESGIGKTSFVSAIAHLAAARGVRVIAGECVAVGVLDGRGLRQGGPLYPFARLLQAVGDRCTSGGPELTAKILGDRGKILAVSEPSLRHVPGVEASPEPADVPGEAARRRIIDALAETLALFAEDRPTLLVLDDLQWADDLTLGFLSALSERYYATSRVLVLGTLRSEEAAPDLQRLAALPYVAELRLDRLDAAAIGAMSSDMLGQRRVPEVLASFLTRESSGNPFFVAEYLRAAVDAGLLFRDERGRWQQAEGRMELDRLGLPRTLAALVSRRLASLEPRARELADLASVLGREVEIDVLGALAAVVGIVPGDGDFEDTVRTLLVRQVLEATEAGSVRFIHDKLREIAYEGLDPTRQGALHGAAGALLERRYAETGAAVGPFATMAHHFERAGDVRKALVYLDKAGEAANAMHANQEAFAVLDRANALEARANLPTPALARARRNRLLGINALAVGNVNRALSSLRDAATAAGRPWPRSRGMLALRCVSAILSEVRNRWFGRWSRLPDSGPGAGDLLLEAARAYERLLAVNYFATGDMSAVVLCALTNMTLSQRVGRATGELALGYATFGAMCSLVPADGMARSYCARAIAVARESGDEVAESWVLVNVGLVHLQACRWSEMREALEQARTMAKKMGFTRRWEEATSQFSTACFLAGRFAESRQLNDELLSSVERADPQSKCWAVGRQAELLLVEGDVDGALAAGAEGQKLCLAELGRAEQIFTLGPLMLARLRAGDLAGARAAADSCADWIARGTAPVFYNISAYAALVEVYLALFATATNDAERKDLSRAARKATKGLTKVAFAMPIALPRARLWEGTAALVLNSDPSGATKMFEKGRARARAHGLAYDEGLLLTALGRRQEATAVFDRIGASYELAKVSEAPA